MRQRATEEEEDGARKPTEQQKHQLRVSTRTPRAPHTHTTPPRAGSHLRAKQSTSTTTVDDADDDADDDDDDADDDADDKVAPRGGTRYVRSRSSSGGWLAG